ncbi:MAG: A/G-specific adenine glycosylase [Thermodesulfobacteriota bacterium]
MSRISNKPVPEKRAFQRSLLRWYSIHQRDLPWRKNQDPYRILISEFMLQQTRVETVIPYFQRFLKIFPTLDSLAKAPLQKVLKAWAGLGYYARARNLHAAAKTIFQECAGKIPSTRENLLKLPGLGPYTAGAVASLAFNQPIPALDGNVRRVISRVFDEGDNPSPIPSKTKIEKFWEGWIPSGRASDFNQALMDLGAMICIPSKPRCSECPVKNFCVSRGTVQKKKPAAKKIRDEKWAVALVEKDGRLMIHQNEGKGLLAGLWQFPTLVLDENGESEEKEALRKFLREEFGLRIKIKAVLPEQEYFFTHIHATMKPYFGSLIEKVSADRSSEAVRWIKPRTLTRYPVSTAMRKISDLFKNSAGN